MAVVTRGSFAKPGTSLETRTGDWRLMRPEHRHRAAPCHVACPAGEDPQAYLARAAAGDLRGAWEALVSANPLPAITGRVCHHPCEAACNRGSYDQPIATHSVERFLGDLAMEQGWMYPVQAPPPDAPRVAIVGGGPAGLAAAYHLVRRGLGAVVFEAEVEAGGLLRSAIPPYRLPRAVAAAEIERLLATGITLHTNHRLGRDLSLDELRADFRAVFLAPGTSRAREWSVDGAAPGDLRNGLDLLKEWISIGALPNYRSVAIIGGGNTAIDLARVLRFRGVEQVHVITFQSMPGPGVSPRDVMSATPSEIRHAHEEGVTIHEHRGIRRLILRDGAVAGVEMVHMREMEKTPGRREIVAFEGTETVLKVDQVIPAVGQEIERAGMEAVLERHSSFVADTWGQLLGHPGIFTGGDALARGGTVSAAIGDGRRAALAIAAYLDGLPAPAREASRPILFSDLNLNYFDHSGRAYVSMRALEDRTASDEIEGALTRDGLDREARRCFSCGECMACDNCWTLCPDNSVLKVSNGNGRYVFDYDHCKGCGICARECPVGYIAMAEEG